MEQKWPVSQQREVRKKRKACPEVNTQIFKGNTCFCGADTN